MMKTLNSFLTAIAIVSLVVFALPASAIDLRSWDRKLTTTRFLLVLNGAAVLDRETQLVWEKSPSTSTFNWFDALNQCYPLEVGGRKGWRVPTIEELASLVDISVSGSPKLPAGHPFSNVQSSSAYWSATIFAGFPSLAYVVFFPDGHVHPDDRSLGRNFVWCVRGGQGIVDGV
jgi:hypothetical protein